MYQENAAVCSQEALSKDVFLLEVAAPQVVAQARPGQFVHVRPQHGMDPILRRPISIHKVDVNTGRLWLLYQLRGKGTENLSRLRVGDILDVLGPLGNGFNLTEEQAPYLIIGGGMGTAPLVYVAQSLTQAGIPYQVILGARTAKDLYSQKEHQALGQTPLLVTDDGSIGMKGNVLAAASKLMPEKEFKTILACGPTPMLRALSEFSASNNIPAQLSLEARMACGVGACLGCTVKKAAASGYYKVCKDGPVFAAEEVELNA